jgi:hypothetical protein
VEAVTTAERVLWKKGGHRVVQATWGGVQAEYLVTESTRFADLPPGERGAREPARLCAARWDSACGDLEQTIYEACILDLYARAHPDAERES